MVFFTLNFFVWGEKSSGAVPFGTMFALLVLWFGISVPLVFLGAYFGYRRPNLDLPTRINQIPRQVPEQVWYMQARGPPPEPSLRTCALSCPALLAHKLRRP